jgi:hypothetical protein
MMDYRFYLFDVAGHIAAFEDISDKRMFEAVQLAEALYEACSDTYGGFELWAGTKCVTGRFGDPHPTSSALMLSQRSQQLMVDLEDNMQTSFAAIARSRKLLRRRNLLDLRTNSRATQE